MYVHVYMYDHANIQYIIVTPEKEKKIFPW